MQVGSRIWVLWGIIGLAPEMCSFSSVPLLRLAGVSVAFNYTTLLYAWAITEVIRYFFYAIKVRLEHPCPDLCHASVCRISRGGDLAAGPLSPYP